MHPLAKSDSQTRVFVVCSGLGVIRRGYESFLAACFQTLHRDPTLDVRLFKGGGEAGPGETVLSNCHRESFAARALGEILRRGPYVIEQVTFALSLLPHIRSESPDVIFFCDPSIGKFLWYWRRLRGGNFRLLFQNSGPIAPPFPWCDHVQQVTPAAVQEAVDHGVAPDCQTLLPCAMAFSSFDPALPGADRRLQRSRLGLPPDRPIVLSVGALNRAHKRMDYLISEVARLPAPRPFLVMLGQEEADAPVLRAMATLLLGEDGFRMECVTPTAVEDYYLAADLFVLASLREGFGLGYVEALAHGLPCIAHDFPVSRYVLGDAGLLADLSEAGALTDAIERALLLPDSTAMRAGRRDVAMGRFSWDRLAREYIGMMHACAAAPIRLSPLRV